MRSVVRLGDKVVSACISLRVSYAMELCQGRDAMNGAGTTALRYVSTYANSFRDSHALQRLSRADLNALYNRFGKKLQAKTAKFAELSSDAETAFHTFPSPCGCQWGMVESWASDSITAAESDEQ